MIVWGITTETSMMRFECVFDVWLFVFDSFRVNIWLILSSFWLIFGEYFADTGEEYSTSAMEMGKLMIFRPKLETRTTGCVVTR